MGLSAFLSTQVIDTTSVGRSVMTAVDAAAARTALGLGTLATQSGTFSGTSSGTNTGDQSVFGTIAVSGQSNVVADQANDTLTLVAGTNVTITTDASTDTITITCTASGLSGTGSVDNAVLRADGTGGSTLQSSAIVIDDLYTSSPNATVNFVSLGPTDGTTNVGLALKPKGTGPLTAHVPDSTSTGGNARGANAVDFQTSRTAAAHVASGTLAVLIGGKENTASGQGASCVGGTLNTASNTGAFVAGGDNNSVSGNAAFASGTLNSVSGDHSRASGYQNTVSANRAQADGQFCLASALYTFAGGYGSAATRQSMRSWSSYRFSSSGDCQRVEQFWAGKTTNATPTTLYVDGSSVRFTIPSGKVVTGVLEIVGIKSDGSAVAHYHRRVRLKNVGGTTSLVGSVETLFTDHEDNASTDVAITADDTNDAIQISVTGIAAETWRWAAHFQGIEIAYGT